MSHDESDVVVPAVDEIAVYVTEGGEIAIVQRGWNGEESTIFIPFNHARTVAEAITNLIP